MLHTSAHSSTVINQSGPMNRSVLRKQGAMGCGASTLKAETAEQAPEQAEPRQHLRVVCIHAC